MITLTMTPIEFETVMNSLENHARNCNKSIRYVQHQLEVKTKSDFTEAELSAYMQKMEKMKNECAQLIKKFEAQT